MVLLRCVLTTLVAIARVPTIFEKPEPAKLNWVDGLWQFEIHAGGVSSACFACCVFSWASLACRIGGFAFPRLILFPLVSIQRAR